MSEEKKTVETKDLVLGILCYLSILIFIPIVIVKDSKFVRFHIKQGFPLLILGLATMIVGLVLGWIPVVGMIIGWVCRIVGLVLLVFAILGIVNVVQGREEELPFVGKLLDTFKK